MRLAFNTPKGTDVSGIALWNGDFANEADPFGDTYVVFTFELGPQRTILKCKA